MHVQGRALVRRTRVGDAHYVCDEYDCYIEEKPFIINAVNVSLALANSLDILRASNSTVIVQLPYTALTTLGLFSPNQLTPIVRSEGSLPRAENANAISSHGYYPESRYYP